MAKDDRRWTRDTTDARRQRGGTSDANCTWQNRIFPTRLTRHTPPRPAEVEAASGDASGRGNGTDTYPTCAAFLAPDATPASAAASSHSQERIAARAPEAEQLLAQVLQELSLLPDAHFGFAFSPNPDFVFW